MDKLPKPSKDYSRITDKIVGKVLSYCTTKSWMCLCLLLSFFPFYLLGIKGNQIEQYSGWWFVLLIFIIISPQIIFRGILRYRDIPAGWSKEAWLAWEKMKNSEFIIKEGWSVLKKKVVVSFLCVFALCVILDIFLGVFPVPILVLWFFVVVALVAKGDLKEKRKTMSEEQIRNESILMMVGLEAGRGEGITPVGWRKLMIILGIVVGVVIGMPLVSDLILRINELQGKVLLISISSLVCFLIVLSKFREDKRTLNEKVMAKLKEKFSSKILRGFGKQDRSTIPKNKSMKYSNPKSIGSGNFQSNFGHWDANRFDPVGDQRRLRGESP